jgi:hypothetical protein
VQSKTINVTTNDPSNRQLKLKVSAQVEMILAIEPATVNFPDFNASEGSQESLYARLSGTESGETTIVSVESNNKYLDVEVEPGGFDGDPARQIRFTLKPGMPAGRFRDRVIFKTDNKNVSTLNLYVRGEALDNIAVDPKHLPLGMITLDQAIAKTIRVYSTTDSFTFNITDVKNTVQGLQTELKTITPGKEYTIVCSMVKGDLPPIIKGEIVITTDDTAQNSVTVRVFGRFNTGPVPRGNKTL